MKKLFLVYYEGDYGEAQGMFAEDGELLGWWACNDADFRSEYLSPFMRKLGFHVEKSSDPALYAQLEDKVKW